MSNLFQQMLTVCCGISLVGASAMAQPNEVKKYTFPLPPGVIRADVYMTTTVRTPRAVLVLCPGRNGSGEGWVRQKAWQDFAKVNRLGMIGISFASADSVLDQWQGYTMAAHGSGQVLLDAVCKIYGRDLPILLFGFSAGAVFTNEFVGWKPERVTAWCACAGEDEAQSSQERSPPGIIACGEYDGSHYGAGLSYFKQGRALGKPWLWVSLPKTEHAVSASLENFARRYFQAVLKNPGKFCWVDVDEKKVISAEEAVRIPSLSAWLPDRKLLEAWQAIHEP